MGNSVMSLPLKRTFELLARTPNPAAIDVLIAALDVPDETVLTLAVGAIVKLPASRAMVEVVRREPTLPAPVRELIRKNAAAFHRCLHQSLTSEDAALRTRAVELAVRLEDYDELAALTRLLSELPVAE